jgi:hypothetical protein
MGYQLDHELSSFCETFLSPPLRMIFGGEFKIIWLQIWGFDVLIVIIVFLIVNGKKKVSGSGHESLVRLATFVSDYPIFKVEVTNKLPFAAVQRLFEGFIY